MREHGTLGFKLIDQILFVNGCGPWNKEAVLQYIAFLELSKKQVDYDVSEWTVLINVTGEPVCTPDVLDLLIGHIKSEKKLGRQATALVLEGSTSPQVGKWYANAVYKKAGEHYQFFDNDEDAENWLRTKLSK